MKKFLSIIAIVLAFLMVVSCGDNTGVNSNGGSQGSDSQSGVSADNSGLVQYPTYPDELPRDYDYEVTVKKGDKTINVPVYNASRQINGYHGISDTDSYRRFCEFAFDGEVEVSVKVKKAMTSYAILPSSKGIESTENNGVITFKLTQPQNVVLRLNDDHNTILSILADPIEKDAPKETDPNVIYFKAGLNNLSMTAPREFELSSTGVYKIPSGYTVYLEPGALVTARLSADSGAENVTIKGRGSVMDPRLDRVSGDSSYMFYAYKGKNITIEDVKFLDAHTFNLCFTDIQNVTIKNVRILSSEISTDGISLWGSPDSANNDKYLVEDCFIYNNDNSFVITSAEDLQIKNCILGTQHGIIYPQGEVHNMHLSDIDVFRMGNFFRATVDMTEDVTWNVSAKNIRCEDALTTSAFVYARRQLGGEKKVVFENVSLPTVIERDTANVQAQGTTNLAVSCTNVFINNGKQLTSDSMLTKKDADGVKFTFASTFDEAAAGVGSYAKAKKTVNFKGEPTITIGNYTVPYDAVGALAVEGYVPANNVLKAINNKKDTTKFMKEIDGVKMISLDFFRNSHKLNVTVDQNGVKMSAPDVSNTNLLKNGGFEKIAHTLSFDMQYNTIAKSTDWTCFNFGGLYVDTDNVKSGSSAMKIFYPANKEAGDRGVVQYISPIIQQYGAGTYRFEIYARLGSSTNATTNVSFGLAESSWRLDGAKNDVTTVALSNEWTKIVHEVKITNPSEGYDHAFFFIGATASIDQAIDLRVDDAALYFSK